MARAALCVGINEFEHLPTASWLNGCVNDAGDVAGMLTSGSGFADQEVTVLLDARATKASVMGSLTEMVEMAERGDVDHVVFSFSSHGTQVPDTDGDEPDQADEALAAHDIRQSGDSWDRDTVIVDDELHALLSRVPKGVLAEVLLDTCHSGTGLRSLDLLTGRRPKFLPPPTPVGLARVEKADPVGLRDLVARGSTQGSRPVLFAACRSDQTASDAHFDGRYNGAFTYHFLKTLRADTAQTRAAILARVSKGLKADSFTQKAQLEASAGAKKVAWGAMA